MANLIEKAAIYQQELDKKFHQQALTGYMEDNAKNVKYNGGAEIKIPSITMQGLGNYDRAGGAPEGDITYKYQTVKLTQDRGRSFTLDSQDVNEANLDNAMSEVMGTFQREYVVPEVEAYRLSKLVALAGTRKRTYTPAVATILKELGDDILKVQDLTGFGVPLVAHISTAAYAILLNSDKLSRNLHVMDFAKGDMTIKVNSYNGVPLIVTPNALMKTAFDFNDGKTVGQEAGGFKAASGAKDVNWIILAKSAPISPCRQDKMRIFDPNTYQKAQAWHTDYRRYYDLYVPNNKLDGIFANVGA